MDDQPKAVTYEPALVYPKTLTEREVARTIETVVIQAACERQEDRLIAQAKRDGYTLVGPPTVRVVIEVEAAGYRRPVDADMPPAQWERLVEVHDGRSPLSYVRRGVE